MLIENTEGSSGGIKHRQFCHGDVVAWNNATPGLLRQTLASLCWIGSVLTYGISSTGDWLQIYSIAWLFANISTVVFDEAD